MAARCSSPEYCKLLLEFDPTRESLQLRNDWGWPPLFYACERGKFETARYLLEMDPDCINVTDDGYNCLHCLFCHFCNLYGLTDGQIIDFVRFLLERAPWLTSSATTHNGNLPLHDACSAGHNLPVIQVLCNSHPEAIYTRNNDGNTTLAEAQDAVITFFQDQLAIINEAENVRTPDIRGRLPLHRALFNVRVRVRVALFNVNLPVGTVKLMIGANLDSALIADRLGQTPLSIACRHCDILVIKYLVEACEDALQISDASGELPLHIACRYGRFDVTEWILDRAIGGCNVVKWILERSDAGVSVQNNEGKTPIQLLLYDSQVDRNSLEYIQAVNALFRAHPDAVMDLCA